MKVLLIGGTGNISSECASWLAERGNEVVVLTRGRGIVPEGCRRVKADRKDPVAMRAAVADVRPEVVVNFLGYELPEVRLDYEVFQGTVGQYVFISSASVYAKPHTHLPLTEESPLGNIWWDYARKKLECEEWLRARWRENGFPVTILRPSHTYSKRWVPNGVSSSSYTFAARLEQGKAVYLHDDGATAWTMTAASDFAVGLGGLLGLAAAIGETFHLTSDEVLTWNQIYGEIASAVGARQPEIIQVPTDFVCQVVPRMVGSLKGDKANPGVFDNSKVKRLVPGFECRKSFRVGIGESVAWLRAHPEEQNLNPRFDEEIERVIEAWRDQGQNSRSIS
jgi:nucleoside-diphosphate-sugar epimerase